MQIVNYDDPLWKITLNKLSENYQDIFYKQEFAKLCQKSIYTKHKIKCAVVSCIYGFLLYPFSSIFGSSLSKNSFIC